MASLSWHSLYGEHDYVDIAAAFTPNINTTAYAHVYVLSPQDQQCSLVYGSDDGIRIWVNGALVQSLRVRRVADPNQNTTPITLKAGWNRLLVKVDQGIGSWGFFMRIVGENGTAPAELYYALDDPEPMTK